MCGRAMEGFCRIGRMKEGLARRSLCSAGGIQSLLSCGPLSCLWRFGSVPYYSRHWEEKKDFWSLDAYLSGTYLLADWIVLRQSSVLRLGSSYETGP